MSKHTPGPWEVLEEKDYPPSVISEMHDICTMSGAKSNPSVMADARLIAAAPELLEALEAVMAEYEDGYGLRCLKQVRSAIAKATGEQQ